MKVPTGNRRPAWDSQRIIFVSGKGGVGKSLVAAAIAREQAEAGRRVLLAEIGDTSYYKDFWNLPAIGHQPVKHPYGFDIALWSGESCLREYVLYYLRMERLYALFFENKVMRALINVAPGLSEIAILGKITSGIRRVGPPLDYDLIVVDSYATGHAMALLQSPRGMMEAIQFGPMGSHSREMEAVIENPALSGYVVVSLLEEMPVVETLEFCRQLQDALGVRPDLIGNKALDLPVSREDLQKLEKADPVGLGEFARYLHAVEERQSIFFEKLKEQIGHSVANVHRVPLIYSAEPETLVRATAEALRAR
jgi:anion-transporting  ArsA/GET3 family ATPase